MNIPLDRPSSPSLLAAVSTQVVAEGAPPGGDNQLAIEDGDVLCTLASAIRALSSEFAASRMAAIEELQKAITLWEDLIEQGPDDPGPVQFMVLARTRLSDVYTSQGKLLESMLARLEQKMDNALMKPPATALQAQGIALFCLLLSAVVAGAALTFGMMHFLTSETTCHERLMPKSFALWGSKP